MTETLPLKPIDDDIVDKLAATIAEREAIATVVRDVVERGLRNVYFVGAGGSIICSYPAHYLLQQKASFPAFQLQSDELNTSVPAIMGPGSLVVLASYTGTTKETVAAAKTAKATGATIIAAAKPGSPLAEAADRAFTGKSDLFELVVAFELLAATGADLDTDAVDQALAALPAAVRHAVEQAEPELADIADAFKDEPITYVLGFRTQLRLGLRPGHVLPSGNAVEARSGVQLRRVLPGCVRDGRRRHRGSAVGR